MSDSGGNNSDGPEFPATHACSEARHTLEQQIEKIHREDQKAVRIFRANMLFMSVVASGIAVAIQSGVLKAYQFANSHMALGIFTILMSTIFSAMSYTSSDFEMGLGTEGLDDARDMTKSEYLNELSTQYKDWLSENDEIHKMNTWAINMALVFALLGIVFFVGGFGVGFGEARGEVVSYIALVFELVLGILITIGVLASSQIFGWLYGVASA